MAVSTIHIPRRGQLVFNFARFGRPARLFVDPISAPGAEGHLNALVYIRRFDPF